MFKLINQNEQYDFYVNYDGPFFNIVPKNMPCGLGGYKFVKGIMIQKGLCKPWDSEIECRIKFYGTAK